jgi:transposase
MSLGEASKHYGIPKTTIYDRMKSSKEQLQLGRPTELTKDEETIIVERLKVMGMWGFPLTAYDLRYLIKSYLDSLGRTVFRHVSIQNMSIY